MCAAMTKLGVVRMRSGRADEGMRLFRQAVEREPKNAEALLYLAGALASGGTSRRRLALLRASARGRTRLDDGAERIGPDASRRRG